jgi:hypothetical protein
MKKLAACVGLGLIMVWMGGCGGCRTSGLVPATGKVIYQGQPLAGANIVAHVRGENTAVAVSDADGKFTLTYNGQNGVPPGAMIPVTVTKVESPYSIAEGERPKTPIPRPGRKAEPPRSLIPEKYGDPKAPLLFIDVPSGGTDKLVLELK